MIITHSLEKLRNMVLILNKMDRKKWDHFDISLRKCLVIIKMMKTPVKKMKAKRPLHLIHHSLNQQWHKTLRNRINRLLEGKIFLENIQRINMIFLDIFHLLQPPQQLLLLHLEISAWINLIIILLIICLAATLLQQWMSRTILKILKFSVYLLLLSNSNHSCSTQFNNLHTSPSLNLLCSL